MATTRYGSWVYAGSNKMFRTIIEYEITAGTDTTATITMATRVEYGAGQGSWPFGSTMSITATINGDATSSTATVHFVRGGTQALGTKTLSITKTHAKQSIDVRSFVGVQIGSTTGGSLASGTQSVPAKTSYRVTFKANGGDSESLPAAQTKWYGETLTLTTDTPRRDGYTFLGWNTDTKGAGTHYAPGASYAADEKLTIYAMWLGVSIPSIECERTDSAGQEADEGTYGTVNASWQAGGSVAATVAVTAQNVTASSAITLDGDTSGSSTAGSSASGSVSALFGADDGQAGALDTDARYEVSVTVTATTTYNGGTTVTKTVTAYVPYAYITIDVRAGGHGVTFGGPAVEDGLHSYMPATFHEPLTAPNIGAITTASDTISVASGTGTALCSVTLEAGTWLIEGVVEFAASATGVRAANLNLASGSTNNSITGCRVSAASSGTTDLPVQWVTKRTAQTTIYLNAYQNSGAALSVTGYIRAMRIQ